MQRIQTSCNSSISPREKVNLGSQNTFYDSVVKAKIFKKNLHTNEALSTNRGGKKQLKHEFIQNIRALLKNSKKLTENVFGLH